jgi:hypothetical protein
MSFQQKKKRIRWGGPEVIALLLLGVVLGAGMTFGVKDTVRAIRHEQGATTWQQTPVRIAGIALRKDSTVGGVERPQLDILFNYTVDGREYEGRTQLGQLQDVLLPALPQRFRDLLSKNGHVTFADLPEDVRRVLSRRGITSFEGIAEGVLDVFRDEEERAILAARVGLGSDKLRVALQEPQQKGIVQVHYNPAQPDLYDFLHFPVVGQAFHVSFFLLAAAALFVYCGWGYPRLKRIAL